MTAERVADRAGAGRPRRLRRPEPVDVEGCLVCGGPTRREEVRLCSRPCLHSARQELERLVAAGELGGRVEDGRSTAVERARALRAALIAWSPV